MPPDDTFSHPGTVHSGDIFRIFREQEDSVLSTTEIDRQIDFASRSTVRRQLISMQENGELRSKKAGEAKNAGQVWYPPETIPEIPQPTPDLAKLIYRYPWLSLIVGGLLSIGFGFLFFIPGFFGQGLYLGVLTRDSLVLVSMVLTGVGIVMAYIGGGALMWKHVYSAIRTWI